MIDIAGLTDTGCKRSQNEDAIYWQRSTDGQAALGIVADGMGGHAGGATASTLAVEVCREALVPLLEQTVWDEDIVAADIRRAISDANASIQAVRLAQQDCSTMGTTIVVVFVWHGKAVIAHIGDSRAYRVRDGEQWQVTRDDTLVQQMLDDGELTPHEATRAPFRNVLTRALGTEVLVKPTVKYIEFLPGDTLLCCSDGLTGALPESDWPALLEIPETAEWLAAKLMEASLANGASDNVSLLVLKLPYFS